MICDLKSSQTIDDLKLCWTPRIYGSVGKPELVQCKEFAG